jgi:hypothetical protein
MSFLKTTLRQKIAEKRKNREKDSTLTVKIPVPTNWVDFARLITIQSGDKFVRYSPYDYQIELDKAFDSHTATIGVKSRQMGWTSYAASKILHKAILNPAYTAIVISQTQNDASLIAHTVRRMLQSIPEYATATNDNLLIQRIDNGGTLHFRSPGPNATRGIPSVSDIIIDEAAFIDNVELLYGQIKNTQSMVGDKARTLIISTPNTVTDWFYEKLTVNTPDILDRINRVRNGQDLPMQVITDNQSGWAKIICHWKAHPLYSQHSDYLQRCANRDQIPIEEVYRERDLSFEDNIENVFRFQLINEVCCVPKFTQEYIDDCLYYFGIDTAGVGKDYFVLSVLEKESNNTFKLVDMYRSRSGTTNLHLFEVSKLIKKYNPYRVSIEVNAGGQNYYDLLATEHPSTDFKAVSTTQQSKARMIMKLLYMMEKQQLKLVNDVSTRTELLSYQKVGDKYGAISGKHDDIVMSLAIATEGISIL